MKDSKDCKPRIIVKVKEGSKRKALKELRRYVRENFKKSVSDTNSASLDNLFSGHGKELEALTELADKLMEAKSERRLRPDLGSYYAISAPEILDLKGSTPKDYLIDSKHDILSILGKHIEHAYIEPGFIEPPQPSIDPLADTHYPSQTYLGPASQQGVGMSKIAGIDGLPKKIEKLSDKNRQTFVDIEKGWVFSHEDLRLTDREHRIYGRNSSSEFSRRHGTSTIGVVGSIKNSIGCNGLANISSEERYDMYCASIVRDSGSRGCMFYDTYGAILKGIIKIVDSSLSIPSDGGNLIRTIHRVLDSLKSGDEILTGSVLLIEEQGKFGEHEGVPLEYELGTTPSHTQTSRDATTTQSGSTHEGRSALDFGGPIFGLIELATLLNITVVEPAGNGGKNLDNIYREVIETGSIPDSGAIVVAAADWHPDVDGWRVSKWPSLSFPSSSIGSRVDCFALGNNVGTLSTKKRNSTFLRNLYRTNFEGTSSASAIIAGVALFTQTISLATTGKYLTSNKLREYMRAGTVNSLTHEGKKIYMPDLEAIAKDLNRSP